MRTLECQKAREERKQKWVGRLSYLLERTYATAWVMAAIFTIYYSNFFLQIWENEKIATLFLAIALVTFGIFFSMTIYAAFVMPNFDDAEVVAPRLIPTMTLIGFISYNSLMIAMWPVWGWYTIPILFIMFMGYLMAGSFMPKGKIGSIAFLMLLIGSGISSNYIPHQGLLH